MFFYNIRIPRIFKIKTGGYGDTGALADGNLFYVPGQFFCRGDDTIQKLLARERIGKNLRMGQNDIGF